MDYLHSLSYFNMSKMDHFSSVLDCNVSLEYMNPGKSFISTKTNFKKCTLRLIRNEFREILLRITDKSKIILTQELKFITIYKKFLNEGKATIKFADNNLTVFISNAPCTELLSFLRLMSIKMVNNEGCVAHARTKLISTKTPYLQDISPLNEKDYRKARMKMENKNNCHRDLRLASENRSDIKAKRNCLLQAIEQSISGEQKIILQAAKEGHNIFFTGSAGTGKSYVLKKIIAALPPDVTFVTASTAVAACQIGGTTLHQFAGVGNGEGSMDHLISLASRPNAQAIWKKCQHLIIDEISMVHGSFFEKLECISRRVRQNEKPFGGIQLILCGDFFQLPPVGNPVLFCFQTKAWEKCIKKIYELKQIHRQSDPVLINILQRIRLGHVTEDIKEKLEKTAEQCIEKKGILATRLCTHTAESLSINKNKIEELTGEIKVYKASDAPEALTNVIEKQIHIPSRLTLKVGAQVMLLKNINVSQGLVNGARGVIVKFDTDNLPIVQFSSLLHKVQPEKFISKTSTGLILTRTQIPLTLAWAFSIHKAQGLTLDCLEISLARVFEPGHSYVAISRVKSLECLRILDFNSKQIWANPEVLKYYAKFRRKVNNEMDSCLDENLH